jgi:D-alanyl-D-alanine carboxypeptidase (penicillin-binding protein 5/6)
MKTRQGRLKRRLLILTLFILLAGGYGYWCLSRPLPPLQPDRAESSLSIQTPQGSLAWPASNQSAVGIVGSDIIDSHINQVAVPTASTAKIITALMVLKKHPLQPGQSGPLVTLTAADVARYKDYLAKDGSVVPVLAGEQISQYQMLQAILLPSANNLADTAAIWAYGSLEDYKVAANTYLAQAGLRYTKVGSDASGLAPDTLSTAEDLVRLGKLAMREAVFADIVNQSTATGIPVVNTIKNVNYLLGTDGIIGIKTGNSEQAGGAFVGAAKVNVNGKPEIIVTAVMNAPNRPIAMQQSHALIKSAQANFKPVTVIEKGAVVGNYRAAWGANVPAVAAQDLKLQAWQGSTLTAKIKLSGNVNKPQAGQTVGQLTTRTSALADQKTVPLKLETAPAPPSVWWRLTHPWIK